MNAPLEARQLRRSRSDRTLAGVCGGLAAYFEIHPAVFRVAFVVLTLLGGAGVLIYLAAAAVSEDFRALMAERMPLVIGFVLVLAFALLLAAFRSLVIAAKAVLLNLLSVGAAYGLIVAVFQWGWGESLLGFESTGAIVSGLPLFLFVVLFGLSMDYH